MQKKCLTKFNMYLWQKKKKPLNKGGTEGRHLNLIKGIYDKLTDDTLNHEKMESFSFKLSNKPRMPTSATFIQRYTGSLSHSDEVRERNKRHTDRKGGSKIF